MSSQVVINDRFTKSARDLDGSVKAKIFDFITKLQSGSERDGLNLKMPKGVVDRRVRTARVDDCWRAVMFELPESIGYVLVSVKQHDDAYKQASKLKMRRNEVSGVLEIIDGARLDEVLDSATPLSPDEQQESPLLEHVKVATLTKFGIPEDVAEGAVTITGADQLTELCDALDELQGIAILELWGGRDPDELYGELFGDRVPEPFDPDDIVGALSNPARKLRFGVGTPEELQEAIEGELAAWRVWLHPVQYEVAYHDGWNGPFRVTGGAGTGKTVTALHRAKHLAQREQEAGATKPTVLLTTFTRNLAKALETQLEELSGPQIAGGVHVRSLDALAYGVLANHGGPKPKIVPADHNDVVSAWKKAASGSAWDHEFLSREWLEVVLAQGITERDEYLLAERLGRRLALNRVKRIDVWERIGIAEAELSKAGLLTFEQAATEAAVIVAATTTPRYRHVIVDESQDLHPAHWRLIRALAPEGPDDVFLVGDAHQRIYGRPVVLSHLGIRTQGRSRRLSVNYRTSAEILRWCLGVMRKADVDDLDGGADTLAGARSEFHGPQPTDLALSTIAEEDEYLVTQVKDWIEEGFEPESIGVLTRTRKAVDEAKALLADAGVEATVIDQYDSAATAGAIQVLTMHRAKGLEFRCVAINRVGSDRFPVPGTLGSTPEEQQFRRAQERSLLYVAGSRARERLTLLHTGPMASFDS